MNKDIIEICAFCSKQKKDVHILITGNTGNICDKCVLQANNIVIEENRVNFQEKIKQDLNLYKPIEIKEHLDQYIVGQNDAKKY